MSSNVVEKPKNNGMMRIFLLVLLALSMNSAWAHSEGKDLRTLERKTRQLTREAERLARQSERYAARCRQAYVSPGGWKRRAERLAERGKEYARLCRLMENSGRKAPGSVRMPEIPVKEVPTQAGRWAGRCLALASEGGTYPGSPAARRLGQEYRRLSPSLATELAALPGEVRRELRRRWRALPKGVRAIPVIDAIGEVLRHPGKYQREMQR